MQPAVTPQAIEEIREEALRKLESLEDLDSVESWRVAYLGRKGRLSSILRDIGGLPQEDRRTVGAAGNRSKSLLEERLSQRLEAIRNAGLAGLADTDPIDVTLPGRPIAAGRLHPTTQIVREICSAFIAMGFQVVEGPEVEWDRYNFELLNIPRDHPARDMWNSLWIDHRNERGEHDMLLRTHTSPMQARVMENMRPPVRVIVPGKCYRYEATDATHEWHFYQVEGLAVDDGITFADLKGTLYEFARRVFGSDRRIRFRCDYFPFVEPGVDMSIDCFACRGRWMPHLQGYGVDRDHGRRHGAPEGPGGGWLRRKRVYGLCLRPWPRAYRHAQVRHRRHPSLLLQRSQVSPAVLARCDVRGSGIDQP